MPDTTFSIELHGVNLPDDIKQKLQAALRSLVLTEIAKTDFGNELSVRPLPGSSERVFPPASPILGFVLQNLSQATRRGATERDSSLPDFIPSLLPDLFTTLLFLMGLAPDPDLPLDGNPTVDVLEALYQRPDIRAAVTANTRTLCDLLSRDEQAMRVFDELVGGITQAVPSPERKNPAVVVGVIVAAAFVGACLGAFSRPA
jgi:hypothetical protein